MTPPTDKLEAETRKEIDEKLTLAGWVVQDKKRINLIESFGITVREMDTDSGPTDYMLFVDGKVCGVIEANREGEDLGHVAEQSACHTNSNTQFIECHHSIYNIWRQALKYFDAFLIEPHRSDNHSGTFLGLKI